MTLFETQCSICGNSGVGNYLRRGGYVTLLSHHTVAGGYLVYCVFLSFCHFVPGTVTDFSAAEKDIGP